MLVTFHDQSGASWPLNMTTNLYIREGGEEGSNNLMYLMIDTLVVYSP